MENTMIMPKLHCTADGANISNNNLVSHKGRFKKK